MILGLSSSTGARLLRYASVGTGAAVLLASCVAPSDSGATAPSLTSIKHILVIYLENWSFDSLYGKFPAATGLAQAATAAPQVDQNGLPYTTLPQPLANTPGSKPPFPLDPRFPATLGNAPFNLSTYVPETQKIGDLLGRFYQEQQQIDGGKMDKFVALGKAGALPLGYYDATGEPLGQLARQYTLADHFFHAAFGTSFLNHMWLISASTPYWPEAPASILAQEDSQGNLIKDGLVTPDGYVVNTVYSANSPHPAGTDPATLLPAQTNPTIGDRLSAKGVDWTWYAGGWNNAVAGHPDKLFQPNHQPFAYFANYADGTPGRAAHLKDEQDLLNGIATNALPAVSFYKPLGNANEHPGYANLTDGEQNAAAIIKKIQRSRLWKDTAIVVTYDENGGFWDHVAPPRIDRFGPGTRVPAIIISPFAKKAYVDHTVYDTTSILALIEKRFGLSPLNPRDATAADLKNAFTFGP